MWIVGTQLMCNPLRCCMQAAGSGKRLGILEQAGGSGGGREEAVPGSAMEWDADEDESHDGGDAREEQGMPPQYTVAMAEQCVPRSLPLPCVWAWHVSQVLVVGKARQDDSCSAPLGTAVDFLDCSGQLSLPNLYLLNTHELAAAARACIVFYDVPGGYGGG